MDVATIEERFRLGDRLMVDYAGISLPVVAVHRLDNRRLVLILRHGAERVYCAVQDDDHPCTEKGNGS